MKLVTSVILTLIFSIFAFAGEPDTTINVVVGGFNPNGSTMTGPYGVADTQDLIQKVAAMLNVPDGTVDPTAPNQIVEVKYYGDTPPPYYTEKDLAAIKAAGKGTPRYALIAAKFIRHRLATTGATHVNLAGGSYGGLISRYLIEHDLEGLASDGLISRWLSLEGVVAGAYPANLTADPALKEFLIDVLGLDISDPLTMHYDWVNEHVNNPRNETRCRHFGNILIGHQISCDDDLNAQLLTMATNRPNDGVLLVEDMFLHDMPPECRFHGRMPARAYTATTHLSAKRDPSFMLNIICFMRGTKRVTLRLTRGRALKFDEDEFFYGHGEVAFQGEIYSPHAAKAWNITQPMAVVDRKHHTAPVLECEPGERKNLDMVLFDWPLWPEEEKLRVKLWAEEIDWDDMYEIEEDMFVDYENLGSTEFEISVTSPGRSSHHVQTSQWELWLEAEVYDYGQ